MRDKFITQYLKIRGPEAAVEEQTRMFWNVGDQALRGIYTLVWSRQKMHHSLVSDT